MCILTSCQTTKDVIDYPFSEVKHKMKELAKRKDFWTLGEMSVDRDYYTMYYKDTYFKTINGMRVKVQDHATVFIRPVGNKTKIDVSTETYTVGRAEASINETKSAELKSIILNFIEYQNKRDEADHISFTGELSDDKLDERLNYKNYIVMTISDENSLIVKQLVLLFNESTEKPEFNKVVTVSGILERKDLYESDPDLFFQSKPVMYVKKWSYPKN